MSVKHKSMLVAAAAAPASLAPEAEQEMVLEKLGLKLPAQPPPRIRAEQLAEPPPRTGAEQPPERPGTGVNL